MKTGALVAFTLCSQTAVGAFLILGVLSAIMPNFVSGIWVSSLILILILMAAGLSASFLHLGSPLKAFLALTHLSSSWLSREVALSLLFTGTATLLLIIQLLTKTAVLAAILTFTAMIVGFALLYSMSKVYMVRTIPSWNTFATEAAFAAASLILGGGLLLVIISIYSPDAISQAGRAIFWVMCAAAVLDLLLVHQWTVLEKRPVKYGCIHTNGSAPRPLRWLHAGLLILGTALFWALTSGYGSGSSSPPAGFHPGVCIPGQCSVYQPPPFLPPGTGKPSLSCP